MAKQVKDLSKKPTIIKPVRQKKKTKKAFLENFKSFRSGGLSFRLVDMCAHCDIGYYVQRILVTSTRKPNTQNSNASHCVVTLRSHQDIRGYFCTLTSKEIDAAADVLLELNEKWGVNFARRKDIEDISFDGAALLYDVKKP